MAQSPQLKQSSPTSPDPQDFRLDATPAMRADNVVSGEHWRIGLITDSLVRFEWSDSGVFENRPTQTVLNRDFGSPVERRVTERDGRVIIDTAALTIVYDQQPFSKEGLSVVVKGVADTQFNTWHYGDAQRGNLKGTARTLDEADGAIELDNGVISRDGWAVIDDSAANIIIETDTVNGKANPFGTWVSPRATAETDLYFFGYGHRYIEAVRDFYRLTGPTPLLPRFAMGNWWSRYYRYTQDGYLALMDRFKREGIPFTTSVIDMDWHRVDDVDPKYGSGWTGYSWNRELFPGPAGLPRRPAPARPAHHTERPPRATACARSRTPTPKSPSASASTRPPRRTWNSTSPTRTSWTPISTCTTAWRPKVSTSGGWTGSRAA